MLRKEMRDMKKVKELKMRECQARLHKHMADNEALYSRLEGVALAQLKLAEKRSKAGQNVAEDLALIGSLLSNCAFTKAQLIRDQIDDLKNGYSCE